MACNRCGRCCIYAVVMMEGVYMADDYRELGRWFTEHQCKVLPVSRPDDPKGDIMALKIPLVCRRLEFDSKTGKAICTIYENRPQICKEHFCEEAKE